jgi:large subunit ribosomal protein L29
MAALKIKQIREMKPEDLEKKLSEFKLELVKELGNVKMGRPVKNPGKIKQLRRAVARMNTVKKEKKREQKKNA